MGIYKTLFLEENYIVKLRTPAGKTSEWLQATLKCNKWKVLLDGDWTELDKLNGYAVEAKKFLNTPIAQVSSSGYNPRDNFSNTSIQWLEYLMNASEEVGDTMNIRQALTGGEYKITGTQYRVDGFYTSTRTVYEFHGCVWHGFPQCYPNDRRAIKTPRTNQSMEELYALTMVKKNVIQKMGYRYVYVWEHEFSTNVKSEARLRDFIQGIDVESRLDPRDAFYGGRTNATKLYYEVENEEKINYVDFW